MERLRRRPLDCEILPPPAPVERPAALAAEDVSPPPMVQVTWGPIVEMMPLAGMTVAEVRALLRGPLNLAPQAAPLVNGRPVGAEHRLVAGEALEFRREFGEKG